MSGYRIQTVHKRTENEFFGRYKGHEIEITRESEEDRARGLPDFYMIVRTPSGGYACDGWCRDAGDSLDAAIEEALRGALLITDDQRRFTS